MRYLLRSSILAAGALTVLNPLGSHAQDAPSDDGRAQLIGEVADRLSGDPIPAASVRLVAEPEARSVWTGQSNEDGEFRTSALPLGEYRVEVSAPPYLPLSEALVLLEEGLVDVRVEMVAVEYELEPIVASARRLTRLERDGFYDRLNRGSGSFMTRAEIETRNPIEVTDLLRGMPGVTVTTVGGGNEVELRRCTPLVVLDRVPVETTPTLWIDDLLTPGSLEAIEVYSGLETPIEYFGEARGGSGGSVQRTDCGVIMLWSRESVLAGGRLLPSWKMILGGAAFVVGAFLATQ
jgi:hypothetical protein